MSLNALNLTVIFGFCIFTYALYKIAKAIGDLENRVIDLEDKFADQDDDEEDYIFEVESTALGLTRLASFSHFSCHKATK